jgi:hypothetical protein
VNIISLHQEVRVIFVITAAVEMQNNLHFVTDGEHLCAISRQNQPFSRKYNLLGLHSGKGNDL